MKENTFLKRSKVIKKNQDHLTEAVQTLIHLSIKAINQGGKLIFSDNGGSADIVGHKICSIILKEFS
jgi:phosphoheptose isomerase|tara:strand:+ start:519 stop:719 length:201 start_codon:yes stop_codon:yes gene_type:complete